MPSWGSRAALLRVFKNGVPALTPVAGFTLHPQAGGVDTQAPRAKLQVAKETDDGFFGVLCFY